MPGSPPVAGGIQRGFLLDNTYYTCYIEYMKDKDLLKLLMKNGWELVSVKGSHHKLRKDGMTEILPVHGTDVKQGLLSAILKRTGLEAQK